MAAVGSFISRLMRVFTGAGQIRPLIFYNQKKDFNMSRRCDVDYLEVQGVALLQGLSATITAVPTSLENKDKYILRYCVKWTGAIGTESLLISVGGKLYPVLTKLGNAVAIGRLRRRELLYLVFSNVSTVTPVVAPHFTLCNELHPICVRTPDITATTGTLVAQQVKGGN
jgi:hypothetical protein